DLFAQAAFRQRRKNGVDHHAMGTSGEGACSRVECDAALAPHRRWCILAGLFSGKIHQALEQYEAALPADPAPTFLPFGDQTGHAVSERGPPFLDGADLSDQWKLAPALRQ